MAPSNMSIQTTAEPNYMDRPSMKQDDHESHNMPAPEHDGAEYNPSNSPGREMLQDARYGATMRKRNRLPVGGDDTGDN